MSIHDDGPPRPSTHVRVIAHHATAMPSPEIRALARLDLSIDDEVVHSTAPVSKRFGTIADAGHTLRTCTPATIALTIWNPSRPDVLVGYGSATWDVFPPALTRGVARIDLKKVAPLVWPDAPSFDLLELARFVGCAAESQSVDGLGSATLIREVNAIANLFAVAVLLNDPVALLHRQTGAGLALDDAVAGSLADLGGDERLEALVQLSALPLRPVWTVPAPSDDPWEWFLAGSEDLRWLADTGDAGEWEQQAAVAELDRRAARDLELQSPRRLLRRTTTG